MISLVAQMVKNLPTVQETWVRSLGQEDPLAKGMATYSSILAWRIPWTEKPGGLKSMGSHRVRQNGVINTHTAFLGVSSIIFLIWSGKGRGCEKSHLSIQTALSPGAYGVPIWFSAVHLLNL